MYIWHVVLTDAEIPEVVTVGEQPPGTWNQLVSHKNMEGAVQKAKRCALGAWRRDNKGSGMKLPRFCATSAVIKGTFDDQYDPK